MASKRRRDSPSRKKENWRGDYGLQLSFRELARGRAAARGAGRGTEAEARLQLLSTRARRAAALAGCSTPPGDDARSEGEGDHVWEVEELTKRRLEGSVR